jgi:hypothetical protein
MVGMMNSAPNYCSKERRLNLKGSRIKAEQMEIT